MHYLSTLGFSTEWLSRLEAAVPGAVVEQITARTPQDVPDDVWRSVEVLHTSSVFPDPAAAPSLRLVQLDTSGADHVEQQGLWASPVPIATIGGVAPVPTAEYVLFAILGFAHRLPALVAVQASHQWPDPAQRWQEMMPASLTGATVVVVGYGRIGREVGRLARAHGLHVVGVTRSGRAASTAERELLADFGRRSPDEDVEVVGPEALGEVLARADYVVVAVPLTAETRGLLGAAAFAALKPGAVLVNVARGGVVDEEALRAALRSGAVRGAVLDVFEVEPLPPESSWWSEPGVFVTPHVAGLAGLYADQVLDIVAQNLRRLQEGARPLNLVDRAKGY